METSSLIFVTGGVRSGKSSFAEKLAIERAKEIGGKLHYVATSETVDEEMKRRIARHQKERAEGEFPWKTWEQPSDIGKLAAYFQKGDVLLLDCLTTLINNELYLTNDTEEEIFHRVETGIAALKERCSMLIIVSNEVLFDPAGENKLVLTYWKLIGRLHQKIVKMADEAYLVECGIPIRKK